LAKPNDTRQYSLKSQSLWLLSAKLIGFSFAFILPLIVVRILTQEEFGLYRQVFLVVGNLVGVLPFGISMTAYYYLAREESKRAAAILNILLVHFAVGAAAFLVLLIYPETLGLIFGSAEMTRLGPLVGVTVWLWLLSFFLEHAAVANREPRHATAFIVFAQLSKTVLMAAFVIWFGTVESIIKAAIIQAAIQICILAVYLNSRFPEYWKAFDLSFLKQHLRYALPLGLAGILWALQTDLHYYFVAHQYGQTAFAIYAVGCFQLPLIAMLVEAVTSVLIPRMSELELQNDKAEMLRLVTRAMHKLALVYFPAYVFLFVTAETFIPTLFTERYLASVPIFLVFLTLLPIAVLVVDPVLRAYGSLAKLLLKLRISLSVVLVASLYFGIAHLDMRGIIAIVVIVRVLEKIILQFAVFRHLGLQPKDITLFNKIGMTAVISMLAGIATYILHWSIREPLAEITSEILSNFSALSNSVVVEFVSGTVILATCFIGFMAIYLTTVYFLNLIDESEKQIARRVIGKIFARGVK
jgi:O-antigen/teichoic acid export membrane protein